MSDCNSNDRTPDWSQVRNLFEQCIELPPQQRTELLAAANADVRSEVDSLLAESATDRQRLDPELGHRSLLASAEQLLAGGRSIGGYTILKVLGHGGMSTVYLAEQEQPRRQVALKLLTGVVSSPEALRRFANEGELLARLQHPGIAQIHDAGVHEEATAMGPMRWPYFVMEYVEDARTLTDYVAASRPKGRELLELFLQVCIAVQHAHERGVVHRDLKPHNILVDNHGAAKVIDFGIARNLAKVTRTEKHARGHSEAQLTQPGDIVGTLHYMSPEQVRGERVIDTRCDVHALGIVLFELLTGKLPFDLAGKTLPELGRILTEVAATPLRRLLPDADVDLELILGKALAKHPDQRYSTAGALAEDLRRYLDSEPINARNPSLRYQLRMFARRRRGLVASALAVVLVSTVGGISSFVYAVRATNAEERAVKQSEAKDEALRRTFDMAVHTVIDLPRRLVGVPHATELGRTLISEAARQLEFVEQNLSLTDEMRLDLARAYFELGFAQGIDASDETAIESANVSHDRCETYLAALLTSAPENPYVLHLRKDLALRRGQNAYNLSRDMPTTEAHWRVFKATLDQLCALPPVPGRDLRTDLANYQACLAALAVMANDTEQEIIHLAACRDLTLQRLADDSENIDAAIALGNISYRLGLAYERIPDDEQALATFRAGTEHLALADSHPEDIVLCHLRAKVRGRYGYTLGRLGEPEQGEQELRWSWNALEQLHDHDPHNAFVASSLALGSSLLGEQLLARAKATTDFDTARACYSEALTVAERGIEITDLLLSRSRDMQSLFVAANCRAVIAEAKNALQ